MALRKLGALLGCDPAQRRHAALPAPGPCKKKPGPGRPRSAPVAEVEAAAGPGAGNDDFVPEKPRRQLPEAMARPAGDTRPEALRQVARA